LIIFKLAPNHFPNHFHCAIDQAGRRTVAFGQSSAQKLAPAASAETCLGHAACNLFAPQFHGHESVTFSRISV
jgi:hypothetical protein